jgi:hypothetical protein
MKSPRYHASTVPPPSPLAQGHLDSLQDYIVDFDALPKRHLPQRVMCRHGEVEGGMDYPRSRLPPLGLRSAAGGRGKGSTTLRHQNAPGGLHEPPESPL